MMYYTHLVFALLLSLMLVDFLSVKSPVFFVAVVLFFSLLPDVDVARSKLGKKSKFISGVIGFVFGHRGLTHSLYLPVLLFVTVSILNYELGLAAFAGYLSHLFLDALTKAGIQPFYPLKFKINGFFRTNSFSEKVLFITLLLALAAKSANYL